jgi:hypothetical protein
MPPVNRQSIISHGAYPSDLVHGMHLASKVSLEFYNTKCYRNTFGKGYCDMYTSKKPLHVPYYIRNVLTALFRLTHIMHYALGL